MNPDAAVAVTEPAPRLLVLVADDDDALRGLIAARLRAAGMDVVEACDAEDVHDYLSLSVCGGGLRPPDVVVTDVRMPGESGPDALFRTPLRDFTIVLMTASLDDEVRALGVELGAAAVFEKPFALGELVRLVRRHVRR